MVGSWKVGSNRRLSRERDERSSGGSRTRKSHRKVNGDVQPLDKKFKVGDSWLMYPGDPSGEAKEIVNCRCTMQSVMD